MVVEICLLTHSQQRYVHKRLGTHQVCTYRISHKKENNIMITELALKK